MILNLRKCLPLPNSLFLSSASFEACESSSDDAANGESAACLTALGSAAALSLSAQQRRWADVLDALLLKASGGPVLTIMLLAAVRRQGLSMWPLRLVLAQLATASCTGPCARSPAPRPVARHPPARFVGSVPRTPADAAPAPSFNANSKRRRFVPRVSPPRHRWLPVCRFLHPHQNSDSVQYIFSLAINISLQAKVNNYVSCIHCKISDLIWSYFLIATTTTILIQE